MSSGACGAFVHGLEDEFLGKLFSICASECVNTFAFRGAISSSQIVMSAIIKQSGICKYVFGFLGRHV